MFDKDGSHLGAIVLDMYPRSGKRVGAWCSSYRSQSYKDGIRVAPISTVTCNFTRPTADAPALLTMDEVENILPRSSVTPYTVWFPMSETKVSRHPARLRRAPIASNGELGYSPEVLKLYAKHYKTGEVIPDELIVKLNNSSLFNKGFIITELTAAALLDMDYHTPRQG